MFELRPYRNHDIRAWNPFSEMDKLERAFFGNNYFGGTALAEFRTDITDEGDHYELKADLPGFNKEDVKLELDGDTLTIKAERHSEHEDKKEKYIRCERAYGSYSRSFDVTGINADAITAAYDNGVLTLTLPKRAPEVPAARQIEIQ